MLDALFGAEEEFEYTASTTPEPSSTSEPGATEADPKKLEKGAHEAPFFVWVRTAWVAPIREASYGGAGICCLLLPFAGLLYPLLYATEDPELFGFPFFYWYQPGCR